jgi:micrococcal nuclease
MHRLNTQVRLLIAFLLVVLAAYIADVPLPQFPNKPEVTGFYKVMQVYDGDTIAILKDGDRLTVRLIGIDSPEVETPYTKAECFGTEASAAVKTLLDGKTVRIETDSSQDLYDTYGRLLAYLYLENGTFVNKQLVEQGFAREYTFNRAYQHQKQFRAAQATAKNANVGMWSTCNS